MVGPKCHVLLRTVVIFLICNFNSSYTTGFSFIFVPIWLLISVSVFPTIEQASLQIYQQRLSVRPSVSLTCIQHWCIPNFYSLINALGSKNVGLMQICTPLSPSLQIFRLVMTKNQIHVHNHARVHIDCERIYDHWAFPSTFSKRESKHVNPYTNTTKIHSLF